jgi:hypothetical protein
MENAFNSVKFCYHFLHRYKNVNESELNKIND